MNGQLLATKFEEKKQNCSGNCHVTPILNVSVRTQKHAYRPCSITQMAHYLLHSLLIIIGRTPTQWAYDWSGLKAEERKAFDSSKNDYAKGER